MYSKEVNMVLGSTIVTIGKRVLPNVAFLEVEGKVISAGSGCKPFIGRGSNATCLEGWTDALYIKDVLSGLDCHTKLPSTITIQSSFAKEGRQDCSSFSWKVSWIKQIICILFS